MKEYDIWVGMSPGFLGTRSSKEGKDMIGGSEGIIVPFLSSLPYPTIVSHGCGVWP